MNTEAVEIDNAEFTSLDALFAMVKGDNDIRSDTILRVWVGPSGASVALKIIQRPGGELAGKPLVFCFHGAVDRQKRDVPVFDGVFLRHLKPNNALVVAVSDPLLEVHKTLRTTWYAGSECFDTPATLRNIIDVFRKAMTPSRTIFVATSTGGHAALTQAWYVPDSVVVVSNPITEISSYYRGHVGEYRRQCWPSLSQTEAWPEHFVDAVAKLYAESFPCNVIYLNNARDHHFWLQAVAFLHAVRHGDARHRLMFLSDYYSDYTGHATPPKILARWVKAACEASSTKVLDIAQLASEFVVQQAKSTGHSKNTPSALEESNMPSSRDIEIANKIFESIEGDSFVQA